VQFLPKIAK